MVYMVSSKRNGSNAAHQPPSNSLHTGYEMNKRTKQARISDAIEWLDEVAGIDLLSGDDEDVNGNAIDDATWFKLKFHDGATAESMFKHAVKNIRKHVRVVKIERLDIGGKPAFLTAWLSSTQHFNIGYNPHRPGYSIILANAAWCPGLPDEMTAV